MKIIRRKEYCRIRKTEDKITTFYLGPANIPVEKNPKKPEKNQRQKAQCNRYLGENKRMELERKF